MKESDLVRLVVSSLKYLFGESCYVIKNHATEYDVRGRPDLEGCIFGRHFGLELKTNSRFTDGQIKELKRIFRGGGIAGSIIFNEGYYFLSINDVINFSLRNRSKWKKLEIYNGHLNLMFLWSYLGFPFNLYCGDYNEQRRLLESQVSKR